MWSGKLTLSGPPQVRLDRFGRRLPDRGERLMHVADQGRKLLQRYFVICNMSRHDVSSQASELVFH